MENVLLNNLGFDRNRKSFEHRFRSMFGISYYIANILMSKMSGPVVPIYLLLALHFLKKILYIDVGEAGPPRREVTMAHTDPRSGGKKR